MPGGPLRGAIMVIFYINIEIRFIFRITFIIDIPEREYIKIRNTTMKKFIAMSLLFGLFNTFASAGYVNGYYKSNGTYVNGYHRSDRNDTVDDNYSTYGNTNPYTGKRGTRKFSDYSTFY